ncbi:uncharacterized protein LOC100825889 [Brachypodium distachyon]|uniref:Uncharacterized protein n=1 Tax=Brachypodium distachyon TaxID=15368 RepID=I1J1M8_BRADI|nr:uncharacterized protein LOC100825889 [Brachypodium distachyon]KQJ84501.1 hypothetical protein BRADI_5g21290v3 [Brachypodium distachyon]|eukprot:XP_003581642.1 uncharacterized protein LOC100825889 [Brachypodium distachyon]
MASSCSSSVLLGGSGAAVVTGATAPPSRPCFLAPRPRALSGAGRLCLQTAPRATPEYKDAADATEGAIDTLKGLAADVKDGVEKAAGKAEASQEKTAESAGAALESAGEAKDSAVEGAVSAGESASETVQDLGGQAKKATEDALGGAKEAALGVKDKLADAVKDLK